VNNILDELHCYYTKATFEEDILGNVPRNNRNAHISSLGIPIEYTVNPATQRTDYIYSSLDLLSYSGYHDYQVRKSAWNESFQLWLPIYISEDHFQRALPYIKVPLPPKYPRLTFQKTMVKLCPHFRSSIFVPEMALDVISKLMNTMVVLLCDHGVAASAKVPRVSVRVVTFRRFTVTFGF
jgi:hypothetical protein